MTTASDYEVVRERLADAEMTRKVMRRETEKVKRTPGIRFLFGNKAKLQPENPPPTTRPNPGRPTLSLSSTSRRGRPGLQASEAG
ncbi:hypothetical protein EYF80_007461 [Liparis tanakae]|uniref:Uncharacterized protein n=1 Tax=Liparis tanakae TaxID=230148 RepID=A0A4Z2IWK8_9TELE|nr:hypothetical protein EYF80_007461 [Liparis tanakae]